MEIPVEVRVDLVAPDTPYHDTAAAAKPHGQLLKPEILHRVKDRSKHCVARPIPKRPLDKVVVLRVVPKKLERAETLNVTHQIARPVRVSVMPAPNPKG